MADTLGCIALRVKVDQEDLLIEVCQSGSQIDAGGRLADTTLLICDRYRSCHRVPLFLHPDDDLHVVIVFSYLEIRIDAGLLT